MISRRFLNFWLVGTMVFPTIFITLPIVAIEAAEYFEGSLNFAGESVPLERKEVFENLDQELLLLSEARARVFLTLRRQSRSLPLVENALKSQNVPNDFKYYPMTLTGLAPTYRSGSLRGPWRLTEGIAKQMGLRVDNLVDERYDISASSLAVAKKLKQLHETYGSWTLALAAFIDTASVNAALLEAPGEKNYYNLYLPEALDKTVSQVLAGKILFSNPQNYGYKPTKTWPVLAKSREVSQGGSLRELAKKYKTNYKTFRDLNPHILTDTVPSGVYLNLP
ncbi:MAG: hypothetical protein LBF22_02375 [Deltaproteobacteria bacterium]|jgi:hypothetical protein|nr:hypothetical protein [Deltaproteobacteria bacterium]